MNRAFYPLLPAAALCLLPQIVLAQATAPAPTPLPVRSVSLFSSGVAYTERGGTVDGNADVPLLFPTDQINDLLKSLVLLDSGGQVQPVTYGARDPISRTLQAFAIDVTQPTARGDLLQRLRGTRVTVTPNSGPTLAGQIVSVEYRTERRADGTVVDSIPVLNLLTDAGLQSTELRDARAVRIDDPRLQAELVRALSALAAGADNSRRAVTLHFAGTGRRAVRVGYVSEAPLWKVSYRLLLGGADAGSEGSKAAGADGTNYLQGWAAVENTTDDDWNGIRLSLVSGRPVSFIEDLYQPLYLPRPVVPVDTIASPYPQTHGANLQAEASDAASDGSSNSTPTGADNLATRSDLSAGANVRRRIYGARSVTTAPVFAAAPSPMYAPQGDNSLFITSQLKSSVQAQARGADAGEQYAYNISVPVTLPRQQSALIPIVAQDIAGDKVLLFNADTDPKFPLDAVRLRNTTGLHLKGGPVTLFDAGVYAGDARLEDLAPKEARIISYAVETAVQGVRSDVAVNSPRLRLSLNRGVLTVTYSTRTEQEYKFISHAAGPRTLVVEQAFGSGDKLVQPAKADEVTASAYRFDVPIQPGKTAALSVITERPRYSYITLLRADISLFSAYAEDTDIPAAQRAVLQSIVTDRRSIANLRAASAARTAQVASLTSDQARIRDNMKALDKASALYKRYTGELDTQETLLQRLRTEAEALSTKAAAAETALRLRLDTLTL